MNYFIEEMIPFIIVGLIIFLLVWSVGFVIYKYTVEIAEANIIKISVAGEKIYEGKKAFVDIQSGGMTTTITIYKKLFPFHITDKVYSNQNVEVM